jgi:hypothetical protein
MNDYDAAINLLIKARDESGPGFSSLNKNLAATKQGLDLAGAASSIFTGLMVGGAARALQTFGQAARDQEVSTLRLANAVDQGGGSWKRQQVEIEKVIDARKRLAFSDNQLMDSLSILTIETGSYEKAQQRQLLAMDLSRAMNVDLVTASRLLGRVNDENVAGLQRMGFAIEKGATETEALAVVQSRVSGAAERYGDSQAGAADKMANAWHDAEAKIGQVLGPIANLSTTMQGLPMLVGGATGAVKFFTQTVDIGGTQMTRFSGVTKGVVGMLPQLARGFGTAALLAGEFFGILKLAEAGGQAGIPFLDQFSNKEGTGSMDLFLKIMEKKGFVGALGLLKDEILGIRQPAETSTQAIDRLRIALGKYPDIIDRISGKMSGKGGGGLARAGGIAESIGKELRDTFGGEGGIALDDPAFAKIEDILNNVIGATPEARYRELGDQLYKRVHDKVQGELIAPLVAIQEELDKGGPERAAALKAYAGEHGISVADALKAFQKEFKDAQTRAGEIDAEVKGLIDRGAAAQAKAVQEFHAKQKNLLMLEKDSVFEVQAAYNSLNLTRAGNTGVSYIGGSATTGADRLAQLGAIARGGSTPIVNRRLGGLQGQLGLDTTVSRPTWLQVGEQGTRERVTVTPEGVGGRGGMGGGGVTIAPGGITLVYGGSADKAAAARLAADVVDQVTEAIRQGQRRLGDRSSPFAT